MIYSNRNCNYPHQIYAVVAAVPPLGDDEGAPDYAGIPKRVLRIGHLPRARRRKWA